MKSSTKVKKRALSPGAFLVDELKRRWQLYLMLVLPLAYLIIFCYVPMGGVIIAFKDYSIRGGIWGSDWVGFKHFINFFNTPDFFKLLRNTLILSLYNLVITFPMPIILALAVNELKSKAYKKVVQMVTYLPYFISTVVLVAMMTLFFSPSSGFINTIIESLGGQPQYFMGESRFFRHLYVWSGVWQSMGYSSIIYIAALSGVSPELHESATIDGANILQRILHIDIPTIMPTMVILLIMALGNVMNVGYEKVYLMQNDMTIDVSEVISTYVYKIGLKSQQFSFSSAIGLFNNVINFIILILANTAANKITGSGLW